MIVNSVLDLMKNTPLVALRGRAVNHRRANLWGKLELAQPGQMKDRIARRLIESAARSGLLRPGGTIIESSSGTMAEGLARVGAILGYRVIIVTDRTLNSSLRAKLLAFGAEIEMVSRRHKSGGWQRSRLNRLKKIFKRERGAYWPRQYDNRAIPFAYADEIGNEISAALGEVHALVAGVGSGSSLSGTAKALQDRNPAVRIVAVDAVGSVQFNQPERPRRQTGHGNSLIAGNIDYKRIHEVHWLNDGEAFNGCRELARREGIYAGGSSGVAYVVASWLAEQLPEGSNVVALFPDRGDRYADTIYNDKYLHQEGLLDVVADHRPIDIEYGIDVAERWSRAPLPHYGLIPYYSPTAVQTASLSPRGGYTSQLDDHCSD
jgi:cysteine synthase